MLPSVTDFAALVCIRPPRFPSQKSLRNNMFELADRLVGIYKSHNVTKSVTINPKQFAQQQQQKQQRQNTLKQAPEAGSKVTLMMITW